MRRASRAGQDKIASRLLVEVDDGFQVSAAPGWMRWLPAGFVIADVAISVLFPAHEAPSFLLVALPVIAAYTLGPAMVGAFTVFAVMLEILLASIHHSPSEQHHVAAYIATVLVGVLGAVLAAHRRRQGTHLVSASSVAEALMHALLRPVPQHIGHILAASLYCTAEAGTMVGGDFYDIRATEAGERAIIGDVRGKGLQAVRIVADMLGSFREAAYEAADLVQVSTRMERRVAFEAEQAADEELFVTAVLIEYDAQARRVTIANHGHSEPLLISHGEIRTLAGPPALPLGLSSLGHEHATAYVHRLAPGDVLLLYTDGLVEARDHAGAFYPLLDRLHDRFAGAPPPGPAEVVDFLNTDLPRHIRHLHDDLAVLAIAPAEVA